MLNIGSACSNREIIVGGGGFGGEIRLRSCKKKSKFDILKEKFHSQCRDRRERTTEYWAYLYLFVAFLFRPKNMGITEQQRNMLH